MIRENRLECADFGLSWSSIFGGIVTAMGVAILLSLFSLGFHTAIFKANTDGIQTFTAGSFIWFIINGTIAMFIAGWISALFAITATPLKRACQAMIVWGFSTVLGVLMVMGGMGAVVAGAGEFIGKTLEITSQTALYALPQSPQGLKDLLGPAEEKLEARISQQIQNAQQNQNQVGTTSTPADQNQAILKTILNPHSDADKEMSGAVLMYLLGSAADNAQELKDTAIQALVNNTDLSSEEAGQALDAWQQTFREAIQKAKDQIAEATEEASSAVSQLAFASFFILLLGAVATILGASVAAGYQLKRTNG